MSREVTSGVATAIQSEHVTVFSLIEMEFKTSTLYATNLAFDIVWDGQIYTGAGLVGAVDEIRETVASEATGLKFQLSGVPSEMIAASLGEFVQGRWARVYTAFWKDGRIIDQPVLEWAGLMDTMPISDTSSGASITVNVESRVVSFKRPNVRRYNSADQQAQYPGDRFFEYVESMAEKPLIWPSKEFYK